MVIKSENIWNITHGLFLWSDLLVFVPKTNCLLLAWCHLCCFWTKHKLRLFLLKACNLVQNICRLFYVLAQFIFTTSKTELDYYYQKVNVRVASRVVEWLKTLLAFDGESSAGHPKAKFRRFSVKNCKISAVKQFIENPILFNFLNLCTTFCPRLYIAIHKFGIICFLETYLDSSTTSDDDNFEISGYNWIHSDIYYKNIFPFQVLNVQYLQERINFELNIGSKIYNFISLCRSPSRNQDEFEKIMENMQLNLESLCQNNPLC